MRIYSRAAFMALPSGVLFLKGSPYAFGGLSVKGETITDAAGSPIDWFYCSLDIIDYDNTGDFVERMDEMLARGASYPINQTQGRDGCYNNEDVFLVYEAADLEHIEGVMRAAREIDIEAKR